MIPVKHHKIITIRTNKITPFVTESLDRKNLVVTNAKGDKIILKPHQLTKELIAYLEATHSIDYIAAKEGRRSLTEIAGVKVHIMPINHTNYDGGCRIQVSEVSPRNVGNTLRVIKYLRKHVSDIEKYCDGQDSEFSCNVKTLEKQVLEDVQP